MSSALKRSKIGLLFLYLQYILVALCFTIPFVWMVMSSFKTSAEVIAYPPLFIFTPTLENFKELFTHHPFLIWFRSSLVITFGSTILGLLLGVPAAYASARKTIMWPAFITMIARMAPGNLFLLPWYLLFLRIRLTGSYTGLILTHTVITMPIILWLMIDYFKEIPSEVTESAIIDGCSNYGVFMRIALPLSLPGLSVATILSFVFSWNYFLFALILSDPETKPLTIAAFNFIGEGTSNWGALMAASTLICLPPIILVLLAQRGLLRGLTLGAVKG